VSTATRTDFELLQDLRSRLSSTRLQDRSRFARELDRLFARRERGNDFDRVVSALDAAIGASQAKVEALRQLPLKLAYDPDLPISAHRAEIVAAIKAHPVIVLCGATGSGKTTQLPKFCLEAGLGALGLIGHTQPRRIAARAIAARLASELGTHVGSAVGYQVRFNDRSGPDTRVKLMTDGILLKELESDRALYRYDTLIIDEAHERSLNIDLLLGVLRRVLEKRADLKLIVTSATIDPQRFSQFFGGAPIIEVSGRSYPVEVRYRPLSGEDEEATDLSLPEGVLAAVRELDGRTRGDVLVFLPGEKQIRECDEVLARAKLGNTEILPLYSRLSTRDQERIFEGHSARRVVLATNVAETSLTVPGIRNVIDSGLARISRYSVRGKVQRLPIERISKASADQRKGRCGRESDGICVRLFSEEDFELREAFTPPEVLRTNLASVILRLAVLGLGEPGDFPFIDPPDTRLINDGYRLLQELKAVDDDRRVTALGRQIAALPVDPRLARMLIAASHHACLAEMLVVASFLEIQDPRERPSDAQTQADQAHAIFADARSDFVAVLNVWQAFQHKSSELSGSQLRKWCREHFLSFVRMREWQELHRQLGEAVDEIDLRINPAAAQYAELHQAILTGFLGNIGVLEEKREYLGARSSRFIVAPGTPLASKPPKWIVAGSIMETTRIFARMVAGIEPQWIESAGAHLLKRSYSEPHWVEQKGFVAASESVSLYGLTLIGQRRVNFGSVDPKAARVIFVREALVEGRSSIQADFLTHNAALREQVEAMEAKIRRRDILVDDQTICDFYLSRLPQQVHSTAAFEKWRKGGSPTQQRTSMSVERADESLRMTLSDLMLRQATEIGQDRFPDTLTIAGNRLPLRYRFEPGQADDGATLDIPSPLLGTVEPDQLLWAVPGWQLESVTELLRALPKDRRRHFVPVPDAAQRFLQSLEGKAVTSEAVAKWIARESGTPMDAEQIAQLPISDHLRINIRALRLDGRVLTAGRDLLAVRRAARHSNAPQSIAPRSDAVHRTWDFGDLAVQHIVERRGVKFTVYPAIQTQSEGVSVIECGTLEDAESVSRRGVLTLLLLALPQQAKFVRKQFSDQRELTLMSQGMVTAAPLADQFVARTFLSCFLDGKPPRTKSEFESLIDAGRSRIDSVAQRLLVRVTEILQSYREVRQKLAATTGAQYREAVTDLQQQLAALIAADFMTATPAVWFDHLPRYLRAMSRRLERLPAALKRDSELMRSIAPFAAAIAQLTGKSVHRIELEKLRWMLEEYRVSLFAQDLKTSVPVSEKRLSEQLQRARDEAAR
jgi:ATP-dependent helicase HrpA